MDGEFPEQFKCPICFEIPEKEIFQCQNGHTICNTCIQSLTLCPQCRVSLGRAKIRNRGLEELLDILKFNCSYKTDGCKAKVFRKEITSHYDNCTFGKEYTTLCKNLGLQCDYKFYHKKLNESLKHLKKEHSFISMKESSIDLNLININNTSYDSTILWTPVILSAFSGHYLIAVYSNEDDISALCFSIGDELNTKLQVKFNITSTLDDYPTLEWITKPISCSKIRFSRNYLPFKFGLDLLNTGYIIKDDLNIGIQLSDNKFNITPSQMKMIKTESICLLPNELNRIMFQNPAQSFSSRNITRKLHDKFIQTFKIGNEAACCNACMTSPVKGILYICLQCKDYDLCSACMLKNEHSFHHFTIICRDEQVLTLAARVKRGESVQSYVACIGETPIGYEYGSMQFDVSEWCCQKCKNQPNYICLPCHNRYGLCKYCFLKDFENHDKRHLFVVTMNDSSRQFALYVLRKSKLLPSPAS